MDGILAAVGYRDVAVAQEIPLAEIAAAHLPRNGNGDARQSRN
jgi:hypothetical protein